MVTFKELEEIKDDDVIMLPADVAKELLAITTAIRSGPDKLFYVMGGRLTNALCAGTIFNFKEFLGAK